MANILLALACSACICHGEQVRILRKNEARDPSAGTRNPLKALASFLLEREATAAFNPFRAPAGFSRGNPALKKVPRSAVRASEEDDDDFDFDILDEDDMDILDEEDDDVKVPAGSVDLVDSDEEMIAKVAAFKAAEEAKLNPPKKKKPVIEEDEDEEDVDANDSDQVRLEKLSNMVFTVLDKDASDGIEVHELYDHLTKSGFSEKIIPDIFKKLDTDGDGMISRKELVWGFASLAPLQSAPGLGNFNQEFTKEIHEDAENVFHTIDRDDSGTIEEHELEEFLVSELDYSPEAIGFIFDELDKRGRGAISMKDFKDAFVKSSALRIAIGQGPNFK